MIVFWSIVCGLVQINDGRVPFLRDVIRESVVFFLNCALESNLRTVVRILKVSGECRILDLPSELIL